MVVPVIMYPGNVVFFIYRPFIMTDPDKQLLAELRCFQGVPFSIVGGCPIGVWLADPDV
jgi:hypothetical protein